jgi:ribosomal protein L44E
MPISVGDIKNIFCKICEKETQHIAVGKFEQDQYQGKTSWYAILELRCTVCKGYIVVAFIPEECFKHANTLFNLETPFK